MKVSLLPVFSAIFAVISAANPRIAIKVSPQVVAAGGTIRVTCTVPRDAANRMLEVGLYPVQSSQRQLDGADARVTWEFYFDHVPCAAERAVCLLHAQGKGDAFQEATVLVAGCDGD